ncbi:glycosyltransferase [Mucilaginibacter gotjawali]|uniref:Glycosyltransferase involved in cell wall biosynthesis n=1 Tax=Mucilaginibacter gotjawali TaxID=1550579 RepID=A0A839SI91_9SPHI|nr:glycosyltransferase [Mucilaginibacter gotjawali]MBB3057092.1 glycosyltransferase involved in cell wall biosynthesis [Mucilaginibacter gotjawali]
MKFSISYIIATRNRLPFLQITLAKLLAALQPDEEIVVVDGNSTDGAKEYLQELYNDGKIHQFITEPDINQAHGWNKAILMANGMFIKKIIDDDVFCYKAIRECKNYMLLNPAVDIVISNDLSSSLTSYKTIHKHSRLSQFEKWKNGLTPSFTFGDVHLLTRKSSLAYIGLYNTAFVMMDWEYSLRISHLRARISYYTGYNALSVGHVNTVTSLKNNRLVNEQGERACAFYEYAGDRAGISAWSKIKIFIGKRLKRAANANAQIPSVDAAGMNSIYSYYYHYISEINDHNVFEFFDSK